MGVLGKNAVAVAMSTYQMRPINGTNPLTLTVANHFLYYPTPKSLNYN